MYYDIIKHYLQPAESHHVMPLAVDVISPDYFLHLIAARDEQWYVIAETDYMPGLSIASDIESAFPVNVQGWRVLTGHRAAEGALSVPTSSLSMEGASEWSEEQWATFKSVAYRHNGSTFVLLQVAARNGASYESFGLTFYKSSGSA